VVLVHHAGKSGQQRGTSAREDALDTVIVLKRTVNDAMIGVDVDLIFEKSRHIAGTAIAPIGFKIMGNPENKDLIWSIGVSGSSKKERALQMVCDGRSYEDIKSELGIGKSTVTKYKKSAIKNGWLIETEKGIKMTKTGKTAIGGDYDF
jgi:putative DNA primase/helicase